MNNQNKDFKISFISFITLIFLTVYGIASPIQFYYQMGYASITYMIIGALVFFIPYAFIVSEMSLIFKNEKGGIFSWMKKSVGENYSLIGTIMWYGSIVTMWFSAASISILISVSLFGVDDTYKWKFLFFSASQTLAIIGVIYMIIAGFLSTRGIKKMELLSKISIITLIIIHLILIIGGVFILILDHFKFAQSFKFNNINSYFLGINPNFKHPLAIITFMVYIIFGYGGMENAAGIVDKLKNPKKTIKKGIIGGAIFIVLIYIIIVITIGSFANWKLTFMGSNVNLANLQIFVVQEEFIKLGALLHLTSIQSLILAKNINRFITILMLIGLTSVPIRIYTPIKHMFEDLSSDLLPKKVVKLNKYGIPSNAIIFQTCIVIFFVLLLGFGGNSVESFFNKITLMISVSSSLPILFIILAYIKLKLNVNKYTSENEVFMGKKIGLIFAVSSFITIAFVNLVIMIQPILNHSIKNFLWIIMGPVFFILIAVILIFRKLYIKSKNI